MDIKEQLILQVKENERLVNELKDLRHFTLNIIHGINGCIELEDWDGLKIFFYDILEGYKHIVDANLSSLDKIKNQSLKELLFIKLKKAVIKNIDFRIMADTNILIESELINENDLYTVISEFLDNAIEAASKACTKKISVFFLTNKNSINIIIENTFNEKPITYQLELSRKGEVSELQSASTILSKYANILNNKFVQHQMSVQELQIIK